MKFFFKRSKFGLVSVNFRFRAEEKKVTSRAEPSWKSFSSSSGSSQVGSDSSLPLTHVGIFLVLSVGNLTNFWPPPNCRHSLLQSNLALLYETFFEGWYCHSGWIAVSRRVSKRKFSQNGRGQRTSKTRIRQLWTFATRTRWSPCALNSWVLRSWNENFSRKLFFLKKVIIFHSFLFSGHFELKVILKAV